MRSCGFKSHLPHHFKKYFRMRKCRNWQTSKTKDLVINAIVWVQVPSPACQAFTGSCKCLFIILQNKVFLVFLYIKPFCLENNIGKEKKKKIKKIKRKEKSFVEYI